MMRLLSQRILWILRFKNAAKPHRSLTNFTFVHKLNLGTRMVAKLGLAVKYVILVLKLRWGTSLRAKLCFAS